MTTTFTIAVNSRRRIRDADSSSSSYSMFFLRSYCVISKIDEVKEIKRRKKMLRSLKKERKRSRPSGNEYKSRTGKTIKAKTCPANIVSKIKTLRFQVALTRLR